MQKDVILYGIIILFVLWIIIEQRLLVTSKHTITSEKLPRQSEASFLVLADLHNCALGKKNIRLYKQIEALAPDFILVAGDMVNKKMPGYPWNASRLLEELAKSYPVFYAYGNHEQKLEWIGKNGGTNRTKEDLSYHARWMEFKNCMTKAQVQFLDNESVLLKVGSAQLRITGVSIEDKYFGFHASKELEASYLTSLLGESAKDCYQILIAHNPIFFDAYTQWGADLTLSGHLHGGMMRIPGIGGVLSPQARFFPKYDAGIYSHGSRHMVVSRGLGSHSIMPRIFNIPELIHIRLTGSK